MKKIAFLFCFLTGISLHSQDYFPINKGVKTTNNKLVAFKNATIYITHNKIIKNGTLVIKEGKVLSVGKSVTIPSSAEIIDLKGKNVYPSFIDMYSSFGIQKPEKKSSIRNQKPQYDAGRSGFYWNDHIMPETKAETFFSFDDKNAKELLDAGFGVVNTHLQDGIVRGNGMLVALNINATNAFRILNNTSAQYLSFDKSVLSKQSYPTSKMGAMALLRQMYIDEKWYAKGNAKNTDKSLEALNKNASLLQIFETNTWLDALRADKIGDEFGIQYTILGGGDEYERISDIKKTNANFIIPINFKIAYDVSNPLIAEQIAISDMRKWNQEPTNLGVLEKNGVNFALTTHNLKSINTFHKNIQKAIKYGLSSTKALESLTTIPANLLGKSNIGNLNEGSYANFLITSGDIFDPKTVLYENWVQGDKHIINEINAKDISGNYTLQINNNEYQLSISGKGNSQKSDIKIGDKKIPSELTFQNNWLYLTIYEDTKFTRLVGQIQSTNTLMQGKAYNEYGNETTWQAINNNTKDKENQKNNEEEKPITVVPISYPNIGFGYYTTPKQQTILLKNATVWTSEKEGILTNTDVLLKNGKIAEIGKNINAKGATIINATNKHVTAGIIDEHSHIAASAVNEAGHNSSAEVSIEDVIDPNDINIYRNLAGGVTSIQILHGSANPIGGQSAIIKLKWGANAAEMIYKNSPKFIKFALGENIKQSNWGENYTVRFPQTRMGAEQVFIDYFQRAKEYDAVKKSGKPYRKDIELEALAEILNKERFISCHSYVQSEINMLLKVAEKFNFKINTFTHILEGYKVADKMKEHGAGGSTFSDWWAYKYEVNDAIPYNASIMANQGITVAINSDDREMSRRLNQEAAKTIKYGGMTELEAWKMVTINPATLLHLEDRTGSIKVGKDADIVLWSDNPLSIYAKAEKTIIDGAIYFDIEKDAEKRKAIKEEKSKLVKMMLQEKMSGGKTEIPTKKEDQNFHCDTE